MCLVLDSNPSPSAGVLSGTTTWLGDYDQCLSVRTTFGSRPLVGKYCLATVSLPRQARFHPLPVNESVLTQRWLAGPLRSWADNDNYYSVAFGLCFPSTCQPKEVHQLLSSSE